MMTSSTDLTVLVTGASRGIGRAIALQLARDGFCVVVHGSKPSTALDETLGLIAQAGGKARSLTFDVCDREAAQQALLADVEANGAYYGIVANAGIARDGTFAAMPSEDWDSVIHTDLTGFYNVVQPMVMPMVRRRKPGRIVVISSVSGVVGNRGQVNYSAAKAGLIGAAKALAHGTRQPFDYSQRRRSGTDRNGNGHRRSARTRHAAHPDAPHRQTRGSRRRRLFPDERSGILCDPSGHRR